MTERDITRGGSEGSRAREYRARPTGDLWLVERELSCINGLSAWVAICSVCESTAEEIGYTDGACGVAADNAGLIAIALSRAAGASDGRPHPVPALTWAIHVRGPDEIVAAKSYEDAVAYSDFLNRDCFDARAVPMLSPSPTTTPEGPSVGIANGDEPKPYEGNRATVVVPDREAIARIIDPAAWAWEPVPRTADEGPASKQAFDEMDRDNALNNRSHKEASLAKADQIIALRGASHD